MPNVKQCKEMANQVSVKQYSLTINPLFKPYKGVICWQIMCQRIIHVPVDMINKIKLRNPGVRLFRLEKFVLIFNPFIGSARHSTIIYLIIHWPTIYLKNHRLQQPCIKHEELGKVDMWFVASVVYQHNFLQWNVNGPEKIPVFTRPPICLPCLCCLGKAQAT